MSGVPAFDEEHLKAVAPGQVDAALALLKSRAGLSLAAYKRSTVRRFLADRAQAGDFASPAEYLDVLRADPHGPAWAGFVSAFTINHTAFFREPHHFEALAQFARQARGALEVWSCAASTGEEAYSIAITLQESGAGGRVHATDIDDEAIRTARAGVYDAERVARLPEPVLRRYFLRGQGERAGRVRVKPALVQTVEFGLLNLAAPSWPVTRQYDAIFCRNVMIYFDHATQLAVLRRLARHLRAGGLLFVGHSENFSGSTPEFTLLGQTVYRRSAA